MRIARSNVAGVVYHVISRFIDREWLFRAEVERAYYLEFLGRALAKSDWRCIAYALMSSHVHLALIAGTASLASWARSVNSTFAQWLNRRHDGLGPRFANRPRDFAIARGNEGKLIAYLHNNPVRAGVVAHARDSSWTSHRAYVGRKKSPPWLHVEEGLGRAGIDNRAHFDAWVEGEPGSAGYVDISAVRTAASRRGGIVVATPIASEPYEVPLVARPFAHVRVDPRILVGWAAEVVGVPVHIICSRQPSGLFARRAFVRCATWLGISQSDTAACLGISRQAVSKIASSAFDDVERDTFLRLCKRAENAL